MNVEWNQMVPSYTDVPYSPGAIDLEDKERWQSYFPDPSNLEKTSLSHWDQSPKSSQSPSTTSDEHTSVEYSDSDWREQLTECSTECSSEAQGLKPSAKSSSLSRPVPTLKPRTTIEGNVGDRSKKRREQNRNAQRAYRERKEQYIQALLNHIEEMNRNHIQLSESYEALKQEATRLQIQVNGLQTKLDVWNKAQLVIVKLPEGVGPNANALGLAPGPLVGMELQPDSGPSYPLV